MPIVFQSPEPVAPAASSAYGAAEIGSRNNAVLAGLYGQAAQINMQSRLGTAELAFRQAASRSHENTVRGVARQERDEQAREFDQARLDRQAAQEFEARADVAKQQQKAELTDWLNGRELSQKEEARLRQMNNAVADIQGDNNLSSEEKVAAVAKLRTGIDVYEMRRQKALAQQAEAHAAEYQKQADIVTKAEVETAAAHKAAAEAGHTTMVHRDPKSGIPELWFWDPGKRVWYNPSTTAGGAKGGAEKPPAGTTTAGEFDWAHHVKQAEQEALAAFPKKMIPGPEGKGQVDENATGRADWFQKVMGRRQDEWRAAAGKPPVATDRGADKESPVAKLDATIEEAKDRKDLLPAVRQQLVGSLSALKKITEAYPDIRTAPPQVQAEAQAAARIIAAAPPPRQVNPERRGLGGPVGPPSGIQMHAPPPQPFEKSWWQRNVVENIPDLPGIDSHARRAVLRGRPGVRVRTGT